ncbi:MAG: hypothetical protein WCA10_20445 [Terracidiphilus sp.]
MLKVGMRVWRNHPVLVAAGMGAVFGAVYAVLIEIGGFLHRNSSAVLPLLLPAAHGFRVGQMNAIQTAGLLLIEMAGNVVGFAVLFSVPVAVAVGVRRIFKGRRA